MPGRLIALFAAAVLCAPPVRAEHGLSTRFADVIIEYVEPGVMYNLRTMRDLPYRISNKSPETLQIELKIEIPVEYQLKPGFEAIPDPSWIRIVPGVLTLGPGEEGLADIVLQVPPGFDNRHFQAHIVAANALPPPGENVGMQIGLSLSSRIRFSVNAPSPAEIQRMKKRGIYQTLNFTMEPQTLYVPSPVEPGAPVNVTKEFGAGLSLINRAPQRLPFAFKTVPPPDGMSPAYGYEAGDPAWLSVNPGAMKVKPESITGLKLEVNIPDDPAHRGKRYMFVVQAGLDGRDIPVEVYSRVYVTTAP